MRADRGTVAMDALQLTADPAVIVLTGVDIERIVKGITRIGAAGLDKDILVAVVVDIGESHTMAFLQVADTGGLGNVGEVTAFDVVEHPVGDERGEVGVAGAEIHIQPAVVVDIAEIRAHRVYGPVEAGGRRYVG